MRIMPKEKRAKRQATPKISDPKEKRPKTEARQIKSEPKQSEPNEKLRVTVEQRFRLFLDTS
jgi:hypothetical protein